MAAFLQAQVTPFPGSPFTMLLNGYAVRGGASARSFDCIGADSSSARSKPVEDPTTNDFINNSLSLWITVSVPPLGKPPSSRHHPLPTLDNPPLLLTDNNSKGPATRAQTLSPGTPVILGKTGGPEIHAENHVPSTPVRIPPSPLGKGAQDEGNTLSSTCHLPPSPATKQQGIKGNDWRKQNSPFSRRGGFQTRP